MDARRKDHENLNSSVVAETMKLLANSSYDHQVIDRSRHSVTKYLRDGKTHAVNNRKMFKKLDLVTKRLQPEKNFKRHFDLVSKQNCIHLNFNSVFDSQNVRLFGTPAKRTAQLVLILFCKNNPCCVVD